MIDFDWKWAFDGTIGAAGLAGVSMLWRNIRRKRLDDAQTPRTIATADTTAHQRTVVAPVNAFQPSITIHNAPQPATVPAPLFQPSDFHKDATSVGLPDLPDPYVQHDFTVIPTRFAIDLEPSPPRLHAAFWVVNLANSALVITDVVVTHFLVSVAGGSFEIREAFNRPGKLQLGPKTRRQYFIEKTLEAYPGCCENFAREPEYSAAVSIEIHFRRGSEPFEYACSNVGVTGVIKRAARPPLSNTQLAAIARAAGGKGKNIQHLIETDGTAAVLREFGDAAALTVDGDVLKLAKALADYSPELKQLVERSERQAAKGESS